MVDLATRETDLLREHLEKLLTTLKRNKDQIPISVLKTKYKKGYAALCKDISYIAEDYAKNKTLHGIRIDKKYDMEATAIINLTIQESGILKELSNAAFKHQDMAEFDTCLDKLRQKIQTSLAEFYKSHLAIYITRGCLEKPDTLPLIYCLVNHTVLIQDTWISVEKIQKGAISVT